MSDWFRFERDVVLRAGAGSGKTYALVNLYLHLVAGATARRQRLAPHEIVAISFTDKAAAELNAKIRERVQRLASGDAGGEPDLVATAAELGVTLPGAAEWEQVLGQLGGAPVGTFHRLGGLLLRRHAVEAAIDPAARQLDDAEAGERLQLCAERAVIDALERKAPDVAQLVVELRFGPSGFAEGLVGTLCRLYRQRAEEGQAGEAGGAGGELPPLDGNYHPEALARGWRTAVDALVAAVGRLASVEGLKAAWEPVRKDAAARLSAWRERLPVAPAAARAEEVRSIADFVAAMPVLQRNMPALKEARDGLREALGGLEAAVRSERAAPLAAALARLVDEVGARYAADKRRLGALDFADLIVKARDLLRDEPRVLAAERARVGALLVDEFQDTNAVQAELVALLAGEGHEHGRLLVVGDRKQSIYGFRGADVDVFLRFEARVIAAGGTQHALGFSRRSRPALVELANALFPLVFHGGSRDYQIAWDPKTDPLTPVRAGDEEALAELLTVAAEGGEAQRAAEARAIAARFAELRREGRDDMALLLRSFTRLDDYLEALRHAGVPHYVVNGRGFFETQEVRDLAAALRLIDDPEDRLALVTVLRSPLVALSDESLLGLAIADRLRPASLAGVTAAEVPGLDEGEAARLARFASLWSALRRRADRLGPSGTLRLIADETQLEVVLAAGHHGEQRVANLGRLVERARAMELAGGDLRSFTRWLSELTEPGAEGADRHAQAQIAAERKDVVRVMTIHQSKGLEFAVVAVGALGAPVRRDSDAVSFDASAGLGIKLRDDVELLDTGPSRRVVEERRRKGDAESLRLFYVAVTRGRDLLLLAGETRSKDTWRGLLDAAIASSPEVARRVRLVPAGGAAEVATTAEAPGLLGPGDAARAEALLARLTPRPVAPSSLTVAVTQLADFDLCPRRHQLFHVVGLAEHPRAARAASTEVAAPDLDALARGTLAHHLLEHADLARGGADLPALLASAGYDASLPEVAEVLEHARRFLATPFAASLGRPGVDVRRELPFLLAVRGPGGTRLRLRGQIDLLCIEGDEVTVVDYKHARAAEGDAYAFQLEAYALAARRLFPSARRVRAGLSFLREADPAPRLRDHGEAESASFEVRLGALGDRLAAARGGLGDALWEGRPVAACQAAGCGYLFRCHPR